MKERFLHRKPDPMYILRLHLRLLLGVTLLVSLLIGCIKPIDLTGLPCGVDGECGADHQCVEDRCVRDFETSDAKQARPVLTVGATCAIAADCDGRAANGTCKTSEGTKSWPNGYCTRSCTSDSACNPDKLPDIKVVCTPIDTTTSSKKECRRLCTSDKDCREGYICQGLATPGQSICVPG